MPIILKSAELTLKVFIISPAFKPGLEFTNFRGFSPRYFNNVIGLKPGYVFRLNHDLKVVVTG